MLDTGFWRTKRLEEMSPEEWEALCDGCGRCCLHKIEDEDSGQVSFTNVACRLLDTETCLCKHYVHRSDIIADCLVLSIDNVHNIQWLPKSCAYRRIRERRGLAWWHPLVSGDPDSVRQAGISVCSGLVSETSIDLYHLEDYIVDWFD